jgi:ribose 5-phosphate isomerase B|tara:strand:- start:17291 stop:17719 length:429 start_codon:yes stop_codon:yes gene_type:complete
MKIIIGSDHAGYNHKKLLIEFFNKNNINYYDSGTYSKDSTDYPDYAHDVAKKVVEDKNNVGVLICGSANGVAMTANKHAGIRAAICWDNEIAYLARSHNDANVICIPARFISSNKQEKIFKTFISQPFEGGRHQKRTNKINC